MKKRSAQPQGILRAKTAAWISVQVIFLLLPHLSGGQKVENIRVRQAANKVEITWDLNGGHPQQGFDARIAVSEDGGSSFRYSPATLSGDLKDVRPGKNRVIVWDVLKDQEKLAGSDFVFEVILTECPTGSDELARLGLLRVRGAPFIMGCSGDQTGCFDDEKPAHRTILGDFHIGRHEVTQALWQEIMGYNPSHFRGPDLPVENVSWNDVQEFLERLNSKSGKKFRLPTEAEWEFAAKGGAAGKATQYSGGNDLAETGWFGSNSGRQTHPAGKKQPNELLLFDLSGNVMEWCSDWYGPYSSGEKKNPGGPAAGTDKVVRGGYWFSQERYCRVTSRDYKNPETRSSSLGFRLAHPVE